MRRFAAAFLATVGLLACTSAAKADPVLDLENLSGAQAEQMLQSGQVTSVQLVRAYLTRIAALNKAGPGLNAVTQINPEALQQAADSDYARAHGKNLGPAMGLPILLKDIIDATPMYTSAGDWALRNSHPPNDSGVAKELKAHGVIILGKLGLSEWANSFGSQPSGFSNLTGQVLNANDAAQGPSGSSSGSGAAGDAALAALTIGTETSGSIISPSTSQSLVGLRPTVGLVPGYGIAPIDVSQDTAGPMVRTVTDSAITLQSIAEVPGSDPTANQEYLDLLGPNYFGPDIPRPAAGWTLPDYSSALDLNFVKGKRIGYNNTECTPQPTCTPSAQQLANAAAVKALQDAGAILVPDPTTTVATLAPLPSGWEQHATIDEYYKGLGPNAPVKNLVDEVAVDNTNPQEGAKDGNSAHAGESLSDDSTITNPFAPTALGLTNQTQFQTNMVLRKAAYHSAVDAMLNCPGAGVTTNSTNPAGLANGTTTCPDGTVNPVIAIIGSAPSTPQAGYPEMVVPMGYTTTQRRNLGVDVFAGPYAERDIIGVGYVIEQATKLRKPVGEVESLRLPLRPHAPGRAVRRPRPLQPGLHVGDEPARQHQDDPAVPAGDDLGAGATGQAGRGHADLAAAREGVSDPDRAGQRQRPRGAGRAGDQSGRAQRRRRERRAPREWRDARAARRHPRAGRRHDQRHRPRDQRGLDRAAGQQAGRRRRPRGQAQGRGRGDPGRYQRHRARRRVRHQHAAGLFLARRPGAVAGGHQQERRRLLGRLDRRGLGRLRRAGRGHGDRHRRRAVDHPGGQLRRRGAEADRRPRQP